MIKLFNQLIFRRPVKIDHDIAAKDQIKGLFKLKLIHEVEVAKNHLITDRLTYLKAPVFKISEVFFLPVRGQAYKALSRIDAKPCFFQHIHRDIGSKYARLCGCRNTHRLPWPCCMALHQRSKLHSRF